MQRVVSKSILKSVLASIFAMAFVVSVASAKFPSLGRDSEKSATVDIPSSTQVPNGPTLAPGTYKVKVLSESGTPQVGFYQNNKLVGQAAVSLVDRGAKSGQTDARFDDASGNHVLTQIDVSGWTKTIQFGQGSGNNGSGTSGQ